MAGLYEKPSKTYAKKRPRYPKEWFSMLASLTAGHHRAWDAGCGSGQASVSVSLQPFYLSSESSEHLKLKSENE